MESSSSGVSWSLVVESSEGLVSAVGVVRSLMEAGLESSGVLCAPQAESSELAF